MSFKSSTKAAVAQLKSFIEAHGGQAQHSEMLELVAHMQGFDSFRAMKAVKEKEIRSVAVIDPNNRALESEAYIVHKASVVDWQLADNPQISEEDLPLTMRTKYEVILEQCGAQFRVLMKPEGVNLDNFEGKPVLDLLIEINEGVPCVHLTNDPGDEMLLAVFATGQGLLLRRDGGELLSAQDRDAPVLLRELAKEACGQVNLIDAHVIVMDTAEKYKDI